MGSGWAMGRPPGLLGADLTRSTHYIGANPGRALKTWYTFSRQPHMITVPPPVRTPFTESFGIPYPIICAPMFLVSTARMVEATGRAGGLGSFPALNYRPVAEFQKVVRELKTARSGPFAVNIIVQSSNKDAQRQWEICLEEGVDLIITSLGNPKELLKQCQDGHTKVYCDVINHKHARKVADLGAHGLVAVAYGAGGHAGMLSPFALIPYLKQRTGLPVVAAGSIVYGAGMLAALGLGADAIYMGTRFIASLESEVASEYKQAILAAACEDIINTDRVDGFPGNFILTESLKRLGTEPGLLEQILTRNNRIKRGISLLRAARFLFGQRKKHVSYKTVFSAGHGVGLIHQEESIADIIHGTIREYHQLKIGLP